MSKCKQLHERVWPTNVKQTTNKDGSTQLRIRQRTIRLNVETPLSKLQTFLLEADNQATNLSIQQTLFN